ncbi:MAG: hypothetical protein JST49_10200 [Bacteroidetes bacterium]|nr:hypothetical protein [Bacteroidota bacterium]
MITETMAAELIITAEPALATSQPNLFKLAGNLAEAVRYEIVNGEFNSVQRDFDTVEMLLKEGNGLVRIAMANVFIYSIVNTLSGRLPFSMKAYSMMPERMKKEYYKQLNSSSI